MKMPAALKTKWVEALRSGKYAQAQGSLCKKDGQGVPGYCCLGVLEMIEDGKVECYSENKYSYASGLAKEEPSIQWYTAHGIVVEDDGGWTSDTDIGHLITLNDGSTEATEDIVHPQPFSVIADWIEKNIEVINA